MSPRPQDRLAARARFGGPNSRCFTTNEHALRGEVRGLQLAARPLIPWLDSRRGQFAPTLIGVANLLLDMYAPMLGQSAQIDELFVKLRNTLEAEMKLHADLAQLLGAMDVLLAGVANAVPLQTHPRMLTRLAAPAPPAAAQPPPGGGGASASL